jgi:heat shock protein HslJ
MAAALEGPARAMHPDRVTTRTTRGLGRAALLLLAGAAAAEPPRPPGPAAAPGLALTGAPTLGELANATYAGLDGVPGPVTLVGGRYEAQPAPGEATPTRVTLGPGFRRTGDLDGDGQDEAVVVLSASRGGSGDLVHLAVVERGARGALRNVAMVKLGDRVQIRSLDVEGGALHASVVRAGPDDAACCPGELADLGWRLAGDRLRPLAETTPTGRLGPDAIGGGEWVLRAWDVGEPAPDEPAVTLAFRDGRLAGTSGCNRYTAQATAGAAPGDVSLGPAASTRMACLEEPAASVEARYLAQLGAVRRLGFHLGRLALTYEKEGGALGTMLFDERPAE